MVDDWNEKSKMKKKLYLRRMRSNKNFNKSENRNYIL